jgi:hypothetical protein
MTKSLLLALALTVSSILPQKAAPPTQAELDGITARGRMLSEYDRAAADATDAVLATHPPQESGETYHCRKLDHGWTCVFGKLSPEKDRFLISYEATQGNSGTQFQVKRYDPPQEDNAFYLTAAKATLLATNDFRTLAEKRPYNAAVLPAASEQVYVYIVPAQTRKGVYPLGGDVRYLISKGGEEIIEKRQLHKSILEMNPSKAPGTTAGGWHTHVLSEVPEDTDVFYVMTRKPPVPEFIAAGKYRYEVKTDGTIRRVK